ncbi:MAG: hypothetical protein ABIS51_18660 [Sphingomonas sp.]
MNFPGSAGCWRTRSGAFDRSLGHLAEVMEIADRVVLIDNSRARRRLILSHEDGRIKYAMSMPPAWANLDRGA